MRTFFLGSQCDVALHDANGGVYCLAYARMGGETRENMEWVLKTVAARTGCVKGVITDNGSAFLAVYIIFYLSFVYKSLSIILSNILSNILSKNNS
jgi:hypothetical protein